MYEAEHFLPLTKVLTKFRQFFLIFFRVFRRYFWKKSAGYLRAFSCPYWAVFCQNCENWPWILQKMGPKI